MRDCIENENRLRAQTNRDHTKKSLELAKINHMRQQKIKLEKLNFQFFNPKPEKFS